MYEKWKNEKYPNICDILNEFPSIKLQSSLLLSQIPKLKPRFYSLSSSNSVNVDEIHLTVGVVQYATKTGKKRFGVCSKWLDEIKKNQSVYAYFKRYCSIKK
jgi:sulfite reductase alpha subunit-like flavoprotein